MVFIASSLMCLACSWLPLLVNQGTICTVQLLTTVNIQMEQQVRMPVIFWLCCIPVLPCVKSPVCVKRMSGYFYEYVSFSDMFEILRPCHTVSLSIFISATSTHHACLVFIGGGAFHKAGYVKTVVCQP